jgi:hypothetical protein
MNYIHLIYNKVILVRAIMCILISSIGVPVLPISTLFSQHASASTPLLDDVFGKYKNYENVNYNVELQYPKDWTYNETGYDEIFPERIFDVIFLSPFQTLSDLASFSISIENLKPLATTLDEYKNRIALNLKNSALYVKDLSISPTSLAGNPAYRLEYMIRLGDAWQKSIRLDSISNGKLYEVSALGNQATIDKYSEDFKNMIESIKFEQSATHSSIQPTTPPVSPSTGIP